MSAQFEALWDAFEKNDAPSSPVAAPRHRQCTRATAIHEAGHAVVSKALIPDPFTVRVGKTTIPGFGDCLGALVYDNTAFFDENTAVLYAAIALAGPIAEARHSHRMAGALASGATDYADVARFLSLICDDQRDDKYHWLFHTSFDIAKVIIRKNWAAVENVADWLCWLGAIDSGHLCFTKVPRHTLAESDIDPRRLLAASADGMAARYARIDRKVMRRSGA